MQAKALYRNSITFRIISVIEAIACGMNVLNENGIAQLKIFKEFNISFMQIFCKHLGQEWQ